MTVLYLETLIGIVLSLALLMALAWVVQQLDGNSRLGDTIWTVGLVGVAGARLPVAGASVNTRQWLVAAALVAIWSLRPGVHIAIRTSLISDDPRSAAFARAWGADSPRMFIFLQNQALGSIPGVVAFFMAHVPQGALRLQGALILVVGIAGEALAEAQLTALRKLSANNRHVCDAGLWRRSRHPNYIVASFCWLAHPVIALALDYPDDPWGWASWLAPAFMYWILVHVTSILPLEDQMLGSRGERYRDYQSRTSRFFPLPPCKMVVT